jgi:hypothetical protein
MDAGDNRYAMSADRRILNPLYSDNRLKLGVFGANVSNGCAATTAAGHLEMTWPNSRDIVTTADRAGFEASVPVARWRGVGGATDSTAPATIPWPGLPAWAR